MFTKKMIEFSFLKGKYVLVLRFSSISMKSVCFSPTSTVIFKPHLANIFLSDFDVISALLGVLLYITASPSSPKIPNSPFLNNFVVLISFSRKSPTMSQISSPL